MKHSSGVGEWAQVMLIYIFNVDIFHLVHCTRLQGEWIQGDFERKAVDVKVPAGSAVFFSTMLVDD